MPRWPLGGGQFTKGPARWCACLEAGDHPEEPGHLCGPGETFAAPGSEPSEEGDGGQDVQLIPKIFPMGQKLLPLAGVRGEARRSEVGRPAGIRLRPLDAGLTPPQAARPASGRAQRLSPCLRPAGPPSMVAPRRPRSRGRALLEQRPSPRPAGAERGRGRDDSSPR